MRLTFVWRSAPRFPIANEAITIAARPICHTSDWRGNAVTSTRSANTSATTFVAADMKAVTGVGAPS